MLTLAIKSKPIIGGNLQQFVFKLHQLIVQCNLTECSKTNLLTYLKSKFSRGRNPSTPTEGWSCLTRQGRGASNARGTGRVGRGREGEEGRWSREAEGVGEGREGKGKREEGGIACSLHVGNGRPC